MRCRHSIDEESSFKRCLNDASIYINMLVIINHLHALAVKGLGRPTVINAKPDLELRSADNRRCLFVSTRTFTTSRLLWFLSLVPNYLPPCPPSVRCAELRLASCAARPQSLREVRNHIGFADEQEKEVVLTKAIGFSHTPAPCAASNFSMPSLSPTMTEGNIASWKLKEGMLDTGRAAKDMVLIWGTRRFILCW